MFCAMWRCWLLLLVMLILGAATSITQAGNIPLGQVAAVAAGNYHSCALTSVGRVVCWGDTSAGQIGDGTTVERQIATEVVGLPAGVVAIDAGGYHTCVLVSGGVKCWGYNGSGELGDGSTTDRPTAVDVGGLNGEVTAIAAGGAHTCALAGGGIKCWGYNLFGQVGNSDTEFVPTPVDVSGLTAGVIQVAAGAYHTCALISGGGVKCWGDNVKGQLGDGTTVARSVPAFVSGLGSGVVAIAAGNFHTCALTIGGAAKCWGDNSKGQVGDGTVIDRLTPATVAGIAAGMKALTTGGFHTCALTAGGGVKCWGRNDYGQLGDGSLRNRLTPVDASGLAAGVLALAAGNFHTCALTGDLKVKCWGSNSSGQIGDGTTPRQPTPVDVSGLVTGISEAAAGLEHTCALTVAGGVRCWGANLYGQLGDGTYTASTTAVDVNGLTSGVALLASKSLHSCAAISGGGVKCWGNNGDGQLGDGTSRNSRGIPVVVSGISGGVSAIGTGFFHSCAVTSAGGAKCWGWNPYGQLGDGTTTDRPTAGDVVGLGNEVVGIAVGGFHTCALTRVGEIKCWGQNNYGQLGDGTTNRQSSPVNVIGIEGSASAISAGANHTCARVAGDGLKCWGENGSGQLGDGTTVSRLTAIEAIGLPANLGRVASGNQHTCVLTGVGAKCWGGNEYGQIGDGTTVRRLVAADVAGLTDGTLALALGGYHSCAVSGGDAKCWGDNLHGQIGDGHSGVRVVPVVVMGAATAPLLAGVVSRKLHGGAGALDLPLAEIVSNPSTEPRQGPMHTIVFSFDKSVNGGSAAVTEGTATVGAPTFSGSEMRVPLSGVANQQYVTVAVSNVAAADGGTGGSGAVRVGFLAGDVNQSRVVTLADLGLVNAQVAQPVTAVNFLRDINVSGTLSLADKGLTNAQLTKSLPVP